MRVGHDVGIEGIFAGDGDLQHNAGIIIQRGEVFLDFRFQDFLRLLLVRNADVDLGLKDGDEICIANFQAILELLVHDGSNAGRVRRQDVGAHFGSENIALFCILQRLV